MLAGMGLEVHQAWNGKEAVELCKARKFGVCVCIYIYIYMPVVFCLGFDAPVY